MAVTVKLPTQLRGAAGVPLRRRPPAVHRRRGARGALRPSTRELRERIAGDDGEPRRFVNVYVGGEDIRFLDGLATPVADGDEVTILPAVAGGDGRRVRLRGLRPVTAGASSDCGACDG